MKDFFRQSKQQKVVMEEERLNKKNRITAAITTAVLQGLCLVAMFVLIASHPPNPPFPESGGVELNFGMDTEGYGEVQPTEPVGNHGDQAEAPKRQEEPATKPEVKEEPQPEVKQPARVPEPVDVKPEVAERNDDPESPVLVKEKKPEEKKPLEKPVEKTPEKVVEKAPEVKVEEKKPAPAPTLDSKAVFKPKEQTATGTGEGGEKAGTPGNHGDDKGKVGDKGNPQGSLDAKALYGQPGSGGGAGGGSGVSMSGFNGFAFPNVKAPELPDDAFGEYEFLVKVDDQGEVISVTPLKRGLSLEAERKLKAVIQQLVFVPKGSNLPPQSEGKITFRVVSR